METTAQVYDLSKRSRQQPLFTFSTTGGSNAEPGIITSVGPLAPTTVPAVLISVAGKGAHGVSEDAKRTARVIAATFQNSWLPEVIFQLAKKPGRPNVPENYKSKVMSGTGEAMFRLLGATANGNR